MSDTDSGTAERLVAYLRGTIGSDLRSVVRYRADSYERLYGDGEFVSRAAHAVFDGGESHPAAMALQETAGPVRGTVRLHDDLAVLHLPHGNASGTLVVVASEGLSELRDLIGGAHQYLRGGDDGGQPVR